MKTSIEYLPQIKQAELSRLVELIEKRFSKTIEMVILYGSYARNTWVEDKYVESDITYEYKSDYDILLVTKADGRANSKSFAEQVKGYIDRNLEIDTPINFIFHGYGYIINMLRESRYFFCDIYYEGIVLYNQNERVFPKPSEVSYAMRLEKAHEYMEKWYKSALRFLEGFDFYLGRGEEDEEFYKNASLELHQTAERLYITTILIFTDYKPKTHDLDILNTQVIKEDSRFSIVFPQVTQEEKDMFNLLREAYISSRYKKNFVVTREQLEYLAQRVELLKELTFEVCNEKIKMFQELS